MAKNTKKEKNEVVKPCTCESKGGGNCGCSGGTRRDK